jgi:hypothetical protein
MNNCKDRGDWIYNANYELENECVNIVKQNDRGDSVSFVLNETQKFVDTEALQ